MPLLMPCFTCTGGQENIKWLHMHFACFIIMTHEAVETRFLINLGVLVMELEKKADNGNEIDFDALIENVKGSQHIGQVEGVFP